MIERGELEEKFMSHSATPLKASTVKVRGTGSAGGLGSEKSNGKSTNNKTLKAVTKVHAKVLKIDGVVRNHNIYYLLKVLIA